VTIIFDGRLSINRIIPNIAGVSNNLNWSNLTGLDLIWKIKKAPWVETLLKIYF
jgi:hypothetical protein